MKIASLRFGLAVVGLLALGLGPGIGPRSLHADEERPEGIRASQDDDGILRVPVFAPINTLDPATSDSDSARLVVLNAYAQLYRYHHTARPFRLVPDLAAALPSVSEDRLTWTIPLRPGVAFCDDPCFPEGKGREVTAQDAVWCFKRLMDARTQGTGTWLFERQVAGIDAFTQASRKCKPHPKGAPAYSAAEGYPEVVGFQAVDRHTLRITLARPYPALPWVLATDFASIYPREAVLHHGAEFGRRVVGAGPYVVDTFQGDRLVMLKRNPAYRKDLGDAAPSEGLGPLPRNRRVLVQRFGTLTEAWTRFQAGQLDVAEVPRDGMWAIVSHPALTLLPRWTARGATLHDRATLEVHYDAFNMRDPVLGTPAGEKGLALRRAICLATDDEWASAWLYGGLTEPLTGPLLKEFPEHDPFFVNPWQRLPGDDKSAAQEEARALLAEAGYPEGKGVPVLRKQILPGEGAAGEFTRLKEDLAAIGLKIEAEVVAWPALRERIKLGNTTFWSISWRLDHPDAENLLQLFHGPYAWSPNDSGYANEEFDAMYREALTLPPGDERTLLYQDMQEHLGDACVYRWRFRRRVLQVTQPWLDGWQHNGIAPRWFAHVRSGQSLRADWLRHNRSLAEAAAREGEGPPQKEGPQEKGPPKEGDAKAPGPDAGAEDEG